MIRVRSLTSFSRSRLGRFASSSSIVGIDPPFFRCSREFAAWLGLTPRQNSTGGKERLGRISKKGNTYIRRLLATGATTCDTTWLVPSPTRGKTSMLNLSQSVTFHLLPISKATASGI